MIYTSRYANPELKSGNYTTVRISVGAPRWKVGYEIVGVIRDLMPGNLRKIETIEEFKPLYYEQLDEIGVDRIRAQFQQYETLGKPVVLLCFEDIRKGSWNWCHRSVFASWWFEKTGEVIEELKDDSPFKAEPSPKQKVQIKIPELEIEEPKKKFVVSEDEKILIKISYSLWSPAEKTYYLGGDVYYQVDRVTGKMKRMFDKQARELISEGKADIILDYDSIEKVGFVLSKDSTVRAYRVNKSGQKKEIDFKDAIKLAASGMLSIQDIEIEN